MILLWMKSHRITKVVAILPEGTGISVANFTAIHLIAVKTFQPHKCQPCGGAGGKDSRIMKVIRTRCLGDMNICTKCNGNP